MVVPCPALFVCVMQTTWGHAWLAADVVYDDKFAPKVVDLNSGPSFYHSEKGKDWPAWYVSVLEPAHRAFCALGFWQNAS